MTDRNHIINGITKVAAEFKVKFRLSLNDGIKTEWSPWIGFPEQSYVEVSGIGPVLLCDVSAIEIDPIEKKTIQRLNKSKIIDHSIGIKEILDNMNIIHGMDDEIISCEC